MSRELARSLGVLGHQSAWRQALQAFQEFQQLQQREPAAVAYNALLVCLARGRQLSRALKGLWQFREQRVLVDLEAYGGLISACDKRWQEAFAFLEEAQEQRLLDTALFKQALSCCNDWQQALDLLARMDRWQLPRTQPLFGALLSCFRKGPWQQAVHVLEDAWTSMCPPNAMMSNAALRSCAFGEAWEAALQLLAAMDLPDAEPPDSLSWAASMDACGRASEWLRVLQLLDDVFEGHEEPDKIIYRAAIHSLSSSQWRWSLQLYEEMPFQDPTPLEAVVLSLLEAQSWRQALALSEETRISGRSYAQLLCTAELHGSGPLGVARRGGPPPIRLLSRLGVTVDCPASMPPQFLKRSLADVEVANVVGKTFAGAVGVQGLAFAKTLRKAMSQKYLKGALPYNKDLNLLAHAVEKVASGGTPLEAVERVCRKRWRRDRLWFDVTGGCKAQVIQAALKGLHSAKVLELGTGCGYSAIRLASALPVQLETVEEDPLRVIVARCMIAMSNLNDRIKVWIGKTAVVLPRLGGRFHAVVCDHAGKNFLPDLLFLQHQHLLPRAVVLANHVLKPGAPEFLWEVTRHPTTQVVSVPEFEQPPLEDWMSVTVLTRPLQNDPPAGVLDLVELSAGILDRASDTRSRGRQLGSVDDWKDFVEDMKLGLGDLGIQATAQHGADPPPKCVRCD